MLSAHFLTIVSPNSRSLLQSCFGKNKSLNLHKEKNWRAEVYQRHSSHYLRWAMKRKSLLWFASRASESRIWRRVRANKTNFLSFWKRKLWFWFTVPWIMGQPKGDKGYPSVKFCLWSPLVSFVRALYLSIWARPPSEKLCWADFWELMLRCYDQS